MTAKKRNAWTWVIGYMILIFVLSSLERVPVLGDWDLNDKAKHMALFALFAFLVFRAISLYITHTGWLIATTVLIVSLYGATDEYHQSFVPGRSPDVRDWMADTAAAVIVAAALCCWKAVRPATPEAETRSIRS